MSNFLIYNPVKLHFGKDVVGNIGKSALLYGKKALLMYGKGSVKKNGAYEDAIKSLDSSGIEIVEYNGIKSNPVIEDADKAAELGKRENVDMVVAVGGGSVIDCAKITSVVMCSEGSAWDIAESTIKPKSNIPLLCVLTLAATGTEMNPVAVIQNDKLKKKVGFGSNFMFPKHSFLDPQYTLTVPYDYTAYGIVDLVAHALEAFFGKGDSSLTDKFTISIIDEAFEYGPELMKDLGSYEMRKKIMFAATCALNGMTVWGKDYQDWGVHSIGHVLSVIYDIPHGASLSVAYPAWLKLFKNRIPERIGKLGEQLFNNNKPDYVIEKIENYFKSLGAPISMNELNIDISEEKEKRRILEVMKINNVSGFNYEINEDDYLFLIEEMGGKL